MDYFSLAGIAAELRDRLVGAKVQRITQPSATDIVLSFFGHSGPCRLLISVDPQAPRIHLTHQRRENPAKPPGFCQVARKDLEGARLDSVLLPLRDRILRFDFTDVDGLPRHLYAELMGRNSNLILTDPSGAVRGVLRPIQSDSPRPLRPGKPYTNPPGAGASNGSFGRFADAE
ncbi:MAG: NFACT family protein, partial [Armatimonadaceae bacterium]